MLGEDAPLERVPLLAAHPADVERIVDRLLIHRC